MGIHQLLFKENLWSILLFYEGLFNILSFKKLKDFLVLSVCDYSTMMPSYHENLHLDQPLWYWILFAYWGLIIFHFVLTNLYLSNIAWKGLNKKAQNEKWRDSLRNARCSSSQRIWFPNIWVYFSNFNTLFQKVMFLHTLKNVWSCGILWPDIGLKGVYLTWPLLFLEGHHQCA